MTDQSRPALSPIVPIPENAPRCPALDKADVALFHEYRDAQGRLLQYILRIEGPDRADDRRKSYRPWTFGRASDGITDWMSRALPEPRPLYGLDRLAAHPDLPVVIVEGEKCADAYGPRCPDAVVITWPGGSSGVGKVDLKPLTTRDVLILPDHDAAGGKAAEALVDGLNAVGAKRIRCFDMGYVAKAILGEAPPGCDIADVLEGMTTDLPLASLVSSFGAKDVGGTALVAEPAIDGDDVHATLQRLYGVSIDLPEIFELTDDGVTKTSIDGRGNLQTFFVASPLYVIGRTRTGAGGAGWGSLLAYRAPDRVWETVVIPAALLAGDGREMRETLARRGVMIGHGRNERQALMEYIGYAAPRDIVEVATRSGWLGASYVLPDRVITPEGAPRVMAPDYGAVEHYFGTAGSPAAWKDLARQLGRTSRGAFSISAALCAPLAELVGDPGGGFHLYGKSSRGKTTLLMAAASVWGGGGKDGAVQSWSMTANGGEAIAAMHSGTLLALDEIHLAAPEDIADIVYRLANGRGKARARRDGGATTTAQWRAMILSSGEATVATRLAAGRRTSGAATGGLTVRMIDIPHAASEDCTFEDIGDHGDEGAFVRHVRSEALRHYGHAGPAFAEGLVANVPAARGAATKLIASFVEDALDYWDDPQIARVAHRFGLAAAAGELAADWGIVPWPEGTAMRAALACFRAWVMARGTTAAQEEVNALRQVAAFFEAHGITRFEAIRHSGDVEEHEGDRGYAARDRCGYREQDDEGLVHHVLPGAWTSEICADMDPIYVARLLRDRGALVLGEGQRLQRKVRLPDYPQGTRVYSIRADRLGEVF